VGGKKIIESASLSSLKSKLIASFKGAKSFARIWMANLGIQSTTDKNQINWIHLQGEHRIIHAL
jgi:hypothetical protein